MVLQLPKPKYGEYYSLYYNDEGNTSSESKFYDLKSNKIKYLWRVPTYKEILKLQNPLEQIKEKDLGKIYEFISNENTM